jgi:cytochrome b6-f complex iron-sulfur subunit
MTTPKTTRRTFCTHAVSFIAIGSLIEGCGSPTSSSSGSSLPTMPVLNGNSGSGVVTVSVDGSSPLATVGNAALVQASSGNFLVSRTSQDSFTVVTATCTHEGCTITKYQSGTYGCPCHGSTFSTTGTVQSGPASRSLRQFSSTFANSVLMISLS